jgi:hypothetical protein
VNEEYLEVSQSFSNSSNFIIFQRKLYKKFENYGNEANNIAPLAGGKDQAENRDTSTKYQIVDYLLF